MHILDSWLIDLQTRLRDLEVRGVLSTNDCIDKLTAIDKIREEADPEHTGTISLRDVITKITEFVNNWNKEDGRNDTDKLPNCMLENLREIIDDDQCKKLLRDLDNKQIKHYHQGIMRWYRGLNDSHDPVRKAYEQAVVTTNTMTVDSSGTKIQFAHHPSVFQRDLKQPLAQGLPIGLRLKKVLRSQKLMQRALRYNQPTQHNGLAATEATAHAPGWTLKPPAGSVEDWGRLAIAGHSPSSNTLLSAPSTDGRRVLCADVSFSRNGPNLKGVYIDTHTDFLGREYSHLVIEPQFVGKCETKTMTTKLDLKTGELLEGWSHVYLPSESLIDDNNIKQFFSTLGDNNNKSAEQLRISGWVKDDSGEHRCIIAGEVGFITYPRILPLVEVLQQVNLQQLPSLRDELIKHADRLHANEQAQLVKSCQSDLLACIRLLEHDKKLSARTIQMIQVELKNVYIASAQEQAQDPSPEKLDSRNLLLRHARYLPVGKQRNLIESIDILKIYDNQSHVIDELLAIADSIGFPEVYTTKEKVNIQVQRLLAKKIREQLRPINQTNAPSRYKKISLSAKQTSLLAKHAVNLELHKHICTIIEYATNTDLLVLAKQYKDLTVALSKEKPTDHAAKEKAKLNPTQEDKTNIDGSLKVLHETILGKAHQAQKFLDKKLDGLISYKVAATFRIWFIPSYILFFLPTYKRVASDTKFDKLQSIRGELKKLTAPPAITSDDGKDDQASLLSPRQEVEDVTANVDNMVKIMEQLVKLEEVALINRSTGDYKKTASADRLCKLGIYKDKQQVSALANKCMEEVARGERKLVRPAHNA